MCTSKQFELVNPNNGGYSKQRGAQDSSATPLFRNRRMNVPEANLETKPRHDCDVRVLKQRRATHRTVLYSSTSSSCRRLNVPEASTRKQTQYLHHTRCTSRNLKKACAILRQVPCADQEKVDDQFSDERRLRFKCWRSSASSNKLLQVRQPAVRACTQPYSPLQA